MEIRKVALINYGKDCRKLDVINQNRASIETSDMVRSQINFKRRSPLSRLKLVVPSPEIGLWLKPVTGKGSNQKKIKAIVIVKNGAEKPLDPFYKAKPPTVGLERNGKKNSELNLHPQF
ncbi:uncharacterized protein LOC131172168 [Hevea brasiliensis]|uniref:uncharacterized protein LOC131172168 n=1 Tax=Hevea brasiliensis TaxID=3981 RepID=UPI0025D463FF|nr:uncharacterized protein LOC131172168 [Hevea brasiliensis]